MPGKWPQAKPKHENLIESSTDGGRPLLTKPLVYHSVFKLGLQRKNRSYDSERHTSQGCRKALGQPECDKKYFGFIN